MPPSSDSVRYHQFSRMNAFPLCHEMQGTVFTPLTSFPSRSLTVFSTTLHLCSSCKQSAALPPHPRSGDYPDFRGEGAGSWWFTSRMTSPLCWGDTLCSTLSPPPSRTWCRSRLWVTPSWSLISCWIPQFPCTSTPASKAPGLCYPFRSATFEKKC